MDKSKLSFVLSLAIISSSMILLGSIVGTFVLSKDWVFPSILPALGFPSNQLLVTTLGIISIISSIIIIIGAIILYSNPSKNKLVGIVILFFTLIGIPGSFGGFGIGMVLGIYSGFLAIRMK